MGFLQWKRDAFLDDTIWYEGALAAYKFKGALTLNQAKKDLTGHGYNLTQSNGTISGWANTEFDTDRGCYCEAWNEYCLRNRDLEALPAQETPIIIKTSIVRYNFLKTIGTGDGQWNSYKLTNPKPIGDYNLRVPYLVMAPNIRGYNNNTHFVKTLVMFDSITGVNSSAGAGDNITVKYYKGPTTGLPSGFFTGGVYAYSNGKLYYNGTQLETEYVTERLTWWDYNGYSDGYAFVSRFSEVAGGAFYTENLDADRIAAISEEMLSW